MQELRLCLPDVNHVCIHPRCPVRGCGCWVVWLLLGWMKGWAVLWGLGGKTRLLPREGGG